MSETIGQRIVRLRKARGWTQVQLGEASGVDDQVISKYERGEFAPARDALMDLARALGVTAEEIAGSESTEAEPGPAAVEEFLASAEGKRASPAHALELRRIRLTGFALTVPVVRQMWQEMLARDAGRARERPTLK